MAKVSFPNDGTNLIVNYLPQSFDEDQLFNMFSDCGPIEDYKIIRDRNSRISKGFGFVKYLNKSSADSAISKFDGFEMGKKTIRVSLSRPSSEDTRDANLVVENLPLTMTEDGFREKFSIYGKIITHRIVKDKHGNGSGKAYIRFDKKGEAHDAILGLNGIDIGGQDALSIRFADPPVVRATPELIKSQRSSRSISQPYPTYRDSYLDGSLFPRLPHKIYPSKHRQGYDYREHPVLPLKETTVTNSSDIPLEHHSSYEPDKGWVLFVYNIPEYSTNETLYSLFSRYGAINSVKPYKDGSNRCKGFGFVHMINYNDACSAIRELNGVSYDGKILQVRFKNA